MSDSIVLVSSHFETLYDSDRGRLTYDFSLYLLSLGHRVRLVFSRVLFAAEPTAWHVAKVRELKAVGLDVDILTYDDSIGPLPVIVSAIVARHLRRLKFDRVLFLHNPAVAHYALQDEEIARKVSIVSDLGYADRVLESFSRITNEADLIEAGLETRVEKTRSAVALDPAWGRPDSPWTLEKIYRPVGGVASGELQVVLPVDSPLRGLWTNFSSAESCVKAPLGEIPENGPHTILYLDYPQRIRSTLFRRLAKGFKFWLPLSDWSRFWKSRYPAQIELYPTTVNGLLSAFGRVPRVEVITEFQRELEAPLITVCLTTKDRPDYLQQALASLAQQTEKDFEIIVVDDGSEVPIARAVCGEHSNLTLIEIDNGYLGRARNRAAQVARGRYLIFMDDDNIADPNEIKIFKNAIEKFDEPDLLTCSLRRFESAPNPLGGVTQMAQIDLQSLALINWFSDANFCMKTSAFREIGGFTEDYGLGHEDWELLIKFCLWPTYTKFEIPEALFHYRVQQGSMLSSTQRNSTLRHFRPLVRRDDFLLLVLTSNLLGKVGVA